MKLMNAITMRLGAGAVALATLATTAAWADPMDDRPSLALPPVVALQDAAGLIGSGTDALMLGAAALTGELGERVNDASVTAAVSAELANDHELSVLMIDINTANGHVLMTGNAPSASARDRATLLAQAVKGVRTVDNRLVILV